MTCRAYGRLMITGYVTMYGTCFYVMLLPTYVTECRIVCWCDVKKPITHSLTRLPR